MHKLTGRLLRLASSGALALGLATTAIGAAQAVDIKMWTLVTEGYPEFVAYGDGGVQEDPSGREHHLRELPERGLQDARSRWRSPAPNRPTCSSTGPARTRPGWCARAWRSTSPSSATPPGGFKPVPQRRLAVVVQYDGKNYGVPTDAVSKYFYYDKAFFAEHKLDAADDLRRAAQALPRHPRHRSCAGSLAARQFGALEAQPRHHHAERACARRRRRPPPTTR